MDLASVAYGNDSVGWPFASAFQAHSASAVHPVNPVQLNAEPAENAEGRGYSIFPTPQRAPRSPGLDEPYDGGCSLYQSMISEPVAAQTPWRRTMWDRA